MGGIKKGEKNKPNFTLCSNLSAQWQSGQLAAGSGVCRAVFGLLHLSVTSVTSLMPEHNHRFTLPASGKEAPQLYDHCPNCVNLDFFLAPYLFPKV